MAAAMRSAVPSSKVGTGELETSDGLAGALAVALAFGGALAAALAFGAGLGACASAGPAKRSAPTAAVPARRNANPRRSVSAERRSPIQSSRPQSRQCSAYPQRLRVKPPAP